MKLAETWIEDASISTAVSAFHDEVEEVDEVDEAKDGCGVAAVRVKKGSYQKQNATRACPRNSRCRKKARKENGRGSIQSYFRQMGIGLEALLATGP